MSLSLTLYHSVCVSMSPSLCLCLCISVRLYLCLCVSPCVCLCLLSVSRVSLSLCFCLLTTSEAHEYVEGLFWPRSEFSSPTGVRPSQEPDGVNGFGELRLRTMKLSLFPSSPFLPSLPPPPPLTPLLQLQLHLFLPNSEHLSCTTDPGPVFPSYFEVASGWESAPY